MKLDEEQIAKADPLLKDTLNKAQEDENIRAVVVLGSSTAANQGDQEPHPSEFPSYQAWREAMVERRKSQLAGEIGDTLEKLRDLSLNPRGGTISRAVAVEGTASNIADSLALPGVSHAILDREIEALI